MGVFGHGPSRTSLSDETVLSAEVGCPGIIDTGASKSVIGQRKVKKLIASLPANVRHRVQWGKSDTVFRFGDKATLSSVGAVYIPCGACWMRLEVVSGDTPFLLSNAFLKATAADVSSRNSELIFHQHGCTVLFQVNPKGLFTVELSEVLKALSKTDGERQIVGSCEVVTYATNEGHVGSPGNMEGSATAETEPRAHTAAHLAHLRDQRSAQGRVQSELHGTPQGQHCEVGSSQVVAHGQELEMPEDGNLNYVHPLRSADLRESAPSRNGGNKRFRRESMPERPSGRCTTTM